METLVSSTCLYVTDTHLGVSADPAIFVTRMGVSADTAKFVTRGSECRLQFVTHMNTRISIAAPEHLLVPFRV